MPTIPQSTIPHDGVWAVLKKNNHSQMFKRQILDSFKKGRY